MLKQMISFAAVAGLVLGLAASVGNADVIIYGPTDFLGIADTMMRDVTTLQSTDLNGTDKLFIEYTVSPSDTTSDSWVVLEFNTDGNWVAFTSGGEGAFLTGESGGTHQTFQTTGGSWSPDPPTSDVVTSQHAVRITLDGFSGGGDFSGTHGVTFEIAHNAATVGTSADCTFSGGTVDLGTDDGLDIDLISHVSTYGYNDVNDLTIWQVPEPASAVLLLLGLPALIWRRRKK